jgi:hypothetical protein
MSRSYYEKVNDCYTNHKEFNNIVMISFKLLLEIIDNKTDEEFDVFYTKYMSKFKLKQYYFTRLFNPYMECNFNSFNDTKDFIDKSFVSLNDINFYREINKFMTDINQINIINTNDYTDKKKKKKQISATIKRLVWYSNIGEEVGKAKCLCCKVTDITQMSFNCGHIIAEANGGQTIVSNLKPICQNCNSSMGTKNMEEFMKRLK